jgi:hypothetical protein
VPILERRTVSDEVPSLRCAAAVLRFLRLTFSAFSAIGAGGGGGAGGGTGSGILGFEPIVFILVWC